MCTDFNSLAVVRAKASSICSLVGLPGGTGTGRTGYGPGGYGPGGYGPGAGYGPGGGYGVGPGAGYGTGSRSNFNFIKLKLSLQESLNSTISVINRLWSWNKTCKIWY